MPTKGMLKYWWRKEAPFLAKLITHLGAQVLPQSRVANTQDTERGFTSATQTLLYKILEVIHRYIYLVITDNKGKDSRMDCAIPSDPVKFRKHFYSEPHIFFTIRELLYRRFPSSYVGHEYGEIGHGIGEMH